MTRSARTSQTRVGHVDKLGEYRIVVSEWCPKVEGAKLATVRSFLLRLCAGRMHDIEVTEEDAIFLMSFKAHAFVLPDGPVHDVLLMNRSMHTKLLDALEGNEARFEPGYAADELRAMAFDWNELLRAEGRHGPQERS